MLLVAQLLVVLSLTNAKGASGQNLTSCTAYKIVGCDQENTKACSSDGCICKKAWADVYCNTCVSCLTLV